MSKNEKHRTSMNDEYDRFHIVTMTHPLPILLPAVDSGF